MLFNLHMLKKCLIPQLCFAVIFFTSGLIVNCLQFVLYVCVRPLHRNLYRYINQYLFLMIAWQIVFVIDWWCGIKSKLFMDSQDFNNFCGKEHMLLISNHTYETDGLLNLSFCDRIGMLNHWKVFTKKLFKYVPVAGWNLAFSESIFLERSFEKDKLTLENQVKELADYSGQMALIFCPEGTRFTKDKHKASEDYSRRKNLPQLKHHLQPRTQGFATILSCLNGKVPAIYDMVATIKENEPVKPTIMNLIMGDAPTVYIYVKRIPIEDLPKSQDELTEYLRDIFVKKDKMKESFIQTGDFFTLSGIPRVALIKPKRRLHSLINMTIWGIITLLPIIYYLTRLLFNGRLGHLSFGVGIITFFMGVFYIAISATKISNYGTGS